MRIAILGTGTLAEALGSGWARAGHEIVVAGRSAIKAADLAARLGPGAVTAPARAAVVDAGAVLLAVAHTGVTEMLNATGALMGTLSGIPLIDPTNAMDHGDGRLLLAPGHSHAERVAELAPGAQVIKAFHLFPAEQWTAPGGTRVTVTICGDDPAALRTTECLVRDLGAAPVVFGGLSRARQVEETAGFVISLACTGFDPATAVPSMPATSPDIAPTR